MGLDMVTPASDSVSLPVPGATELAPSQKVLSYSTVHVVTLFVIGAEDVFEDSFGSFAMVIIYCD
jgi:hypothetical protein